MKSNYLPPQEGVLSAHQFTRLLLKGKIIDGRAGGLILGRSFDEGGILAIYKLGTGYVIRGQTEGGEFSLNWQAATENLSRLKAMAAGLTLREVVPNPGDSPRDVEQIIITSARPNDRLVYFHWAQIVINREAASKHLAELVEMNKAPNPYLQCDLYELFHCHPGTEDGIV